MKKTVKTGLHAVVALGLLLAVGLTPALAAEPVVKAAGTASTQQGSEEGFLDPGTDDTSVDATDGQRLEKNVGGTEAQVEALRVALLGAAGVYLEGDETKQALAISPAPAARTAPRPAPVPFTTWPQKRQTPMQASIVRNSGPINPALGLEILLRRMSMGR